jgi:SAM-dependent methyltransferase
MRIIGRWPRLGPVLELGVGSGRIAIPLAERGIRVHGIDLSADMVKRLREKPGGAGIKVTIGDFATTGLDDRFSLAYLVFNTIMNLTASISRSRAFRTWPPTSSPAGGLSSRSVCRSFSAYRPARGSGRSA